MNFYKDSKNLYFFENEQEFKIIYKEIFRNEIYKADTKTPKLIIDIGGHIGVSALYFRSKYPEAKIITYEPNPETYNILLENFKINGMENYEAHQKAITNSHSTRDFYIDIKEKWNSTASLLQKGWNGKQLEKAKISVETLPFSEILEMKPDLIKIDIEGVEQQLIKANVEKLKLCKEYLIEFHQSATQDLRKFLKYFTNAGFLNRIIVDKDDKDLIMVHCNRINNSV